MIVLPIMFYNQIQILVGAVIARRYAQSGPVPAASG
jgi:sodium/bile acid cotransporter 7